MVRRCKKSDSLATVFASQVLTRLAHKTGKPVQRPVSVCLNQIVLQSRFLSGSIARKSHEHLAREIFGLGHPIPRYY